MLPGLHNANGRTRRSRERPAVGWGPFRSSSGAFADGLEGPVGDDGRDQRAEQDDQAKDFCDEAANRPHQP